MIRRLRGKRTQADFGVLVGAPKNTVWRWEAGRSRPDVVHSTRLAALAEQEFFLQDWKLLGSMTLVGDLERAKSDVSKVFLESLERTSRGL